MNNWIAKHEFMLADRKSGLITSISQQKDSAQQRSSMEQASAKAHWLILQLEPIKSGEGVYGCRQADDFGGENDAKHHEKWASVRSAYVIPLDTAKIKTLMSWFKLEVLDSHYW